MKSSTTLMMWSCHRAGAVPSSSLSHPSSRRACSRSVSRTQPDRYRFPLRPRRRRGKKVRAGKTSPCPGVPSPEGRGQDSQVLPRSVSSFFWYTHSYISFSRMCGTFSMSRTPVFPRIPFSQRQVQKPSLRQVFCAREAASLLGFPVISR